MSEPTSATRGVRRQAPKGRSCGAMEHYFHVLDTSPGFKANLRRIERFTEGYVRSFVLDELQVVTIPVVVHVVHRNDTQDISDAQVRSQIDALNRDYRAQNPDHALVPEPFKPLVADARIQFALATVDPKGKPTTGITRKRTRRRQFYTIANDVKSRATGGQAPWDARKYLNIWVCELYGGTLGYAQFPGGPEDTDGVVIDYQYFGTTGTAVAPFNLGRTCVHEVGHYLNLSHIWGEGSGRNASCTDDDYVADTPTQMDKNFGTPTFPHFSCPAQPNGDLFMNYMDYVDDAAMYMFSQGQVARMRATLASDRASLIEGAAARIG